MALFLFSAKSSCDFVATTDPDVVLRDPAHAEGPTRLVPVDLAERHEGATVFRLRPLDQVQAIDMLTLEGAAQNVAICRAGLVAIDGSESAAADWDPDKQHPLARVVAIAIWELTDNPAAFARPTSPGATMRPGSST